MRSGIKDKSAAQVPQEGEKPKRGRPVIELDLDLVEDLAAIQCTDEEIAAVLNVSVDTITRRKQKAPEFAEKLAAGRSRGRASLRRLQWRIAEQGNAAMAIFLGKNLLGQRDKFEEPAGDTNQPLPWVD